MPEVARMPPDMQKMTANLRSFRAKPGNPPGLSTSIGPAVSDQQYRSCAVDHRQNPA
ncbi:hypothetical protein QA447_19560 [Pseudomonas sp. abacavir_1]